MGVEIRDILNKSEADGATHEADPATSGRIDGQFMKELKKELDDEPLNKDKTLRHRLNIGY